MCTSTCWRGSFLVISPEFISSAPYFLEHNVLIDRDFQGFPAILQVGISKGSSFVRPNAGGTFSLCTWLAVDAVLLGHDVAVVAVYQHTVPAKNCPSQFIWSVTIISSSGLLSGWNFLVSGAFCISSVGLGHHCRVYIQSWLRHCCGEVFPI